MQSNVTHAIALAIAQGILRWHAQPRRLALAAIRHSAIACATVLNAFAMANGHSKCRLVVANAIADGEWLSQMSPRRRERDSERHS
jgi:hypothetical protein